MSEQNLKSNSSSELLPKYRDLNTYEMATEVWCKWKKKNPNLPNPEHYKIFMEGEIAWHKWRQQNPDIVPDLRGLRLIDGKLNGANLREVDLSWAFLYKARLYDAWLLRTKLEEAFLLEADLPRAVLDNAYLGKANLCRASLVEASLRRADFSGANLRGANLSGAILDETNLSGADLREAKFHRAYLGATNLHGADLRGADLKLAQLIATDLSESDMSDCHVYGVSTWGLNLEGAKQDNLIITIGEEPVLIVDDIEVAQFIYLLLDNKKIHDVIDTITSKVVLILGRFTPERKAVLDALRNILREHDRISVVFDFDVPNAKNVTDTVKLLAQLARYVIVDLSDPNSAPYELGVISMLGLDSTPVVPLIVSGQQPFPMLADVLQKRWSTDLITYQDLNDLITNLSEKLLTPAEAKVRELRG